MPSGSKDPFALRRASLAVLRIIVGRELDLDHFDEHYLHLFSITYLAILLMVDLQVQKLIWLRYWTFMMFLRIWLLMWMVNTPKILPEHLWVEVVKQALYL